MLAITSSLLFVALAGVAHAQYGAPPAVAARPPGVYRPPPLFPPRPFGYGPYGGHGYGFDHHHHHHDHHDYDLDEFEHEYAHDYDHGFHGHVNHWDYEDFLNEPTHHNFCHKINTKNVFGKEDFVTKIKYFEYRDTLYAILSCDKGNAIYASKAAKPEANDVAILSSGDNIQYIAKCGEHERFIGIFKNETKIDLVGAFCDNKP